MLGTCDHLVACEYNREFYELSTILTNKMQEQVKERVENVCDDLVTAQFGDSLFDGVYSILVFLHIPKEYANIIF